MTLTREEHIFVLVLLINLAVAVLYFLCGALFVVPWKARKREEGEGQELLTDNRRTYLIRAIIMILCPVVGPVFFFMVHLLYLTIFRFGVNLEDVVFEKDRVETQVKANEEQERNVIPVEEAIAVNDKKSMRMAMMNIIRGEMEGALSSIALALDAEDSETAHYAASVLSDKLNEFRMNVRKLQEKIQEEPDDQTEYEEEIIDYMDNLLKQRIFTALEQNGFVQVMAAAAEQLYTKDASRLTGARYEGVCMRLLEIENFEDAEKWCIRLAEQYPDELCSYTCRLKLYFTIRNREAFFQTLNALKKSDVLIDNETLEMIRVFS